MTREEILSAINDKNYQALLDIYDKYKIDRKFDAFFNVSNPDTMRVNMLVQKVKDIFRKIEQSGGFQQNTEVQIKNIEVTKLDFKKKKAPTKERVVIDSNPHVNRADLPSELQKVYDENGKMYGEMKSMHAALKVETNEEKRKVLANDLTLLEDNLNANWTKIDNWYQDFKEGNFKPENTDSDPVAIANKIGAAKRYLGRYSKSEKPEQIEKCKEYSEFLAKLKIKFSVK
jgi:hypothetical protein